MPAIPELSVYSHQQKVAISDSLLAQLESAAHAAIPKVINVALGSNTAICLLDEIEVSIIDDATIADVHLQFMNIPGATDVITFDHGEIHISVETAQQQALEYGNSWQRELMLYIIHGLLHLAGYEDASDSDRERMDRLQQSILTEVWNEGGI